MGGGRSASTGSQGSGERRRGEDAMAALPPANRNALNGMGEFVLSQVTKLSQSSAGSDDGWRLKRIRNHMILLAVFTQKATGYVHRGVVCRLELM